MLAASRDEGYWIRERVFGCADGAKIDLYLVENPYYGLRRDGRGPSDITVSDHGLMALAMVLEARALLVTCERGIESWGRRLQHGRPHGSDHGGGDAVAGGVRCARHGSFGQRDLYTWAAVVERGLRRFRWRRGGQRARTPARVVRHCRSSRAIVRRSGWMPRWFQGAPVTGMCLQSETERLHRHWKGSSLRWIEAGHFSALLTQRRALCDCVEEAVAKL